MSLADLVAYRLSTAYISIKSGRLYSRNRQPLHRHLIRLNAIQYNMNRSPRAGPQVRIHVDEDGPLQCAVVIKGVSRNVRVVDVEFDNFRGCGGPSGFRNDDRSVVCGLDVRGERFR